MIKDYGKKVASVFLLLCFFIASYGTTVAQGLGIYQRAQIKENLSSYLQDIVDLDKVTGINEDSKTNEVNLELNDGSNTVYTFSEPVWYEDSSGNMKFKETDIKKQKNSVLKKKGYEYSNGENDYRLNFSNSYKNGILVSFDEFEYKIVPETSYKGQDIIGGVEKIEKENETYDAFSYANLYGNGTKLIYTPQMNCVKEEIILDKYKDQNNFEFTINTKNCYIQMNNGSIEFVSSETKKVVQSIPAPFAYDSKNNGVDIGDEHYTSDCNYSVDKISDNKYKLTLTVSEEWLKSDSTVYPVTIDPVTSNISNSMDVQINSLYFLIKVPEKQTMDIGKKLFNGTYRGLYKFDMPSEIKPGATINSAYYWSKKETGNNTSVQACLVTSSWNNDTTWSSSPSFNDVPFDTKTIHSNDSNNTDGGIDNTWYKFDLTSAVAQWNQGTANNGFLLKSSNEGTNSTSSLYTQDCSTAANRPYTIINYTNDTTAPTVTSVTGNTSSSEWTTQPVTLSVNGAQDLESGLNVLPYSFSTSQGTYNWQSSNISPAYTSPQTVYVYVRDAAGNIRLCSTEIIQVDTDAPTITDVSGNPTNWVNDSVTLTINGASDGNGSGLHQNAYSFSSEQGQYKWQSSNTKIFSENQTVYIYVKDILNNIRLVQTVVIDKIDTGNPVITSIDKTIDENNNIILTVNSADNNSGVKEYSFDNGNTWQTSNTKAFINLENVKVKIKDNAGNTAGYIPPAPTSPTSTDITDKTVSITWTAPTDSIEISEYRIYNGSTFVGTTSNTSYTITGLSNNTDYTFTVKSVNILGDVSDSSTGITVKTGIGVPENIITTAGTSSIAVSWDALEGADAYDVLVGDTVYSDIPSTTYNITGLTQGTNYEIKVRAKALSSTGAWSNIIQITTGISQEVSGTISQDTTWTACNSPYIVSGNIIVDNNVTLTIEPGTVIRVMEGCYISVNGKLIADGTSTSPIVFTSFDDVQYGGTSESYWLGIIGQNTAGEIIIDNAIIRYTGSSEGGYGVATSGKLSLTYSIIEENFGFGVMFAGESDSNISNNTISSSLYGIYVLSQTSVNLLINNNTISAGNYGAYLYISENANITFNYNQIESGLAGVMLSSPNTDNINMQGNIACLGDVPNGYTQSQYNDLILAIQVFSTSTSLILSNNTFNTIQISANINITSDISLPRAIYRITGINIAQNAKLSIAPGAVLNMAYDGKIIVNGEIEAIGSSTMPITFQRESIDDANPDQNYWSGIEIANTGKATFDRTIISNGCRLSENTGTIYCSGDLTFFNSQLTNSKAAGIYLLYFTSAQLSENIVQIQNNIISNNKYGIYVDVIGDVDLNISNNSITNNECDGIYVARFAGKNSTDTMQTHIFAGCSLTGRDLSEMPVPNDIKNGGDFILQGNTISGNNGYAFNLNTLLFCTESFSGFSNNTVDNTIKIGAIFINNDFVLPKANYEIQGMYISPQANVSFAEGSVIKQRDGLAIFNEGTLSFNGTQEDNIVLTSVGDPSYGGSNPTNQSAIFNKGTLSSEYTRFKYGGYYGNGHKDNEPITVAYSNIISSGTLNIQKSTFEQGLNAIEFCTGSNLLSTIKYNSFVNNGGAIINCNEGQLDAGYNYWGSPYGPSICLLEEGVYYNTGGDAICGNINCVPIIGSELGLASYFGIDGTYSPTGSFSRQYTDLNNSNSIINFSVKRTYNSKNDKDTLMGRGWTFGFEANISDLTQEYVGAGGIPQTYTDSNIKVVHLMDGSSYSFTYSGNNTYTASGNRNTLKKVNDVFIMTTKDQTSYGFGSNGKLIWIDDKNGNRTTISYNAAGNPVSVTDYANRSYVISYNSQNKIESVTDTLSSRAVTYTYTNGNLSMVTGPTGDMTYYEYDSSNYLTWVKDNQSNTIDAITYFHTQGDDVGKVNTMTDENGKITTYLYDYENKRTIISDQNNRQTIQYYDGSLSIIKVDDEEGKSTITEYPEQDSYREPKATTDRDGNKTSFERDSRGNIINVTNPDGSTKEMRYNTQNNVTRIKDENDYYTYFVYDESGINLIKKLQRSYYSIGREYDGSEENYSITTYTYYPQSTYGIKGLLHTKTDPEGNITTYTYDSYGNIATIKDGENKITTYTYNSIGLLTHTISAKGYETTYYYDANGREIKRVLHNGETYRTVYDTDGNILQDVSPNQYNVSDDIGGVYDADKGTRYTYYSNNLIHTKTDENGNVTIYTYDIYGNKLTETLPNGAIYRYEYDVMNRVSKLYYKQTSSAFEQLLSEYSYSAITENNKIYTVTETKTYTYTDDTNYNVSKSYFDYAGREVKEINPDNTTFITAYNANGTIASETDSRGNTTHYQYDHINRLTGKWAQVSSELYAYTGYTYDYAGRVTKEEIGVTYVALNSVPQLLVTQSYTYDGNGRVVQKTDVDGAKIVYSYDDDGNLSKKEEYKNSTSANITEYEYNHLGKVTKIKQIVRKGDIAGNSFSDDDTVVLETLYSYDANGNLLSTTAPNGVITTNTYDNMNNLLSTSMSGTDENGNNTTITVSKTYNCMGEVETETDALGNTKQFVYDGFGNLIKEIDALGGVTAYYYDLAGRMVAVVSPKNYQADTALSEMNRTEYTYNSMGNVITQTQVYFHTVSNLWTSFVEKAYAYDANGNVTKQLNALGYAAGTGTTALEKIASGYGTEYTYDGTNRVLTELSAQDKADGRAFTKSYTYDGLGRNITQTNANGVITIYAYDVRGNVTSVSVKASASAAAQTIASYTYDHLGNKLSETDANGNTTTYTYNALGKVASATFAGDSTVASITRYYQYDSVGNLIKQWDTTEKMITYTYNNQNKVISKTVSKINGTQSITYTYAYDINGNLRFETDGNGVQTQYTYNALGKKLSETKAGKTTTYTYDANGNVLTTTDWLGNVYTNTYDALNRLIKKTDPYGKTIEILAYNNNHQQITSTDALGHTTQFSYDLSGRLLQTIDPAGNIKSKTYDAVGNIATETDGNENTTQYTYDEFGRLTSVVMANNETTAYTYDLNGNLLTQTDARGMTTTFEYNVANLRTKIIDHGGRTVSNGEYVYDNTKIQSFTYTPDGLVATQTKRDGTVITYAYDVNGRMLSKSAANQGTIQTTTYTYDNNSNLLTVTNESGTITRTYDAFGRVLTKSVPGIGTTTYVYDITDGMQAGDYAETSSYPQGETVTKVFDKAGRLSKVIASGDTTSYNYNDNGSIASVVYDNGAKEEYTYTANNLLSTLTNKRADDTVISAYSYTYDAAGNILSKTDETGTTTYTYDSINRLQAETYPSGKTIAYTYDGSGNRQTETTTVGTVTTVTTYTYDMSNRLTSTQSVENSVTTQRTDYTYELNGNMLEKLVTPYDNGIAGEQTAKLTNVYDLLNQLTMSTTDDGKTVCNTYNGEGLRIQKSVTQNGTTTATKYLYDGDKVVAEYDGNNDLKAQNIRGINLLMRIEQNASYYYMYNGHADVTALMNASTGAIDATYYYDAFGTLLSQTGSVSNSYLYAGYQYDAETGLYYLNARMYDSVTARFIQEDTYRGNPNDPLSLNLYTYCANNPLIYHDPTGHWREWVDNAKKWTSDKYHSAKNKVKSGINTTVKAVKTGVNKTVNKVKSASKEIAKATRKTVDVAKKKVTETIGTVKKTAVTVGKKISSGAKVASEFYDKNKEAIHTGLDVLGAIPVVGEVFDAINTVAYLAEGDYVNAALSAASLIPVAGIGAAGLKFATKYGDEVYSGAKALIKSDFIQSSVKTLKSTSGSVNLGAFGKALGKNTDEVIKGGTGVVKTPYGDAVQSLSKDAKTVKTSIENGGTVYRGGTLGRSNAAEGQFWAPENPLNPGYADRYGVDFSKIDFIIGGKVKPNSNIITRPAPGLGTNGGGAIEMVTDPNNVKLDFFYMP